MESKVYFDSIAEDWETIRQGFFPPLVREKAIDIAALQPGQRALDVGAGSGFLTEGLLAAGLQVVASDQSEAMLQELRRRLGNPESLQCLVGDAAALPLAGGSFDAVFANMVLHHMEDPGQAIGEWSRLLRAGGVLVVSDLDAHSHEFLRSEQHDRWLGFQREEIRDWLQEGGLEEITVNCAGADCCSNSGYSGEKASISIFIASGRKGSPREAR